MDGVVKRLVTDKGFGFIQATDSVDEYFFHRSACDRGVFETLREGSRVRFEASEGPKGPRAESVEFVDATR